MRLIDAEAKECWACTHHATGKCDTFCDHGESFELREDVKNAPTAYKTEADPMQELLLRQRTDGKWEEYKLYATIVIETEEEFLQLQKKLQMQKGECKTCIHKQKRRYELPCYLCTHTAENHYEPI